jgi:hypothetical protein
MIRVAGLRRTMQVSQSGGSKAAGEPDGRELFYRGARFA